MSPQSPRRPNGANGAEKRGSMRSRTVWAFDRVARWISLIVVVCAMVVLVAPSLRPTSTEYRLGESPGEDIRAPFSFEIIDSEKRRREVEHLDNTWEAVYERDDDVPNRAIERASRLLSQAFEIHKEGSGAGPSEALRAWARREQDVELTWQAAQLIMKHLADGKSLEPVQRAVSGAVRFLYAHKRVAGDPARYGEFFDEKRVTVEDMDPPYPSPGDVIGRAQIAQYLRSRYFEGEGGVTAADPGVRVIAAQVAETYAQPSLLYSATASAERLKARKEAVRPTRSFEKGQVIVRHDQDVGPRQAEILHRMDRAYAETFYKRLVAVVLYVVLLFILVFYYIRQLRPDLRFDTRNVFLFSLPVLLALFVGRVELLVFQSHEAASFAFPAGLIGMLAVILFDVRTAVLLVTVGCLAFSIPTGLDFKVFITALMGGYAAVTVLTSVQERKEVLKAGLVVGIVNALVIVLVSLLDDPNEMNPWLILWGMGNGLLCGVFAMPALTLFENLLGVVTDIRLLELTGLGHPLLERLEREAPGSYQHCLNVTKLSEAAAKAIGGNFLLVRAGSLYHDIGKIVKPKYFGENQISLDEKSLHSKISPYMSAMVIKNHVKAGMEMARRYKIPQRIVDFIPQHHGTTIISYFYHEALKRFENSESTDPVRESDFRYPGPKPQSIETAIVMLADSVEATVTSRFTSLSVNEDELYLVVQRSVLSKFNDGQFDECDLTFRHLEDIRRSFVSTLLSRFHHRVAYPSTPALSGAAAPAVRRDRLVREEEPAMARSES